jgi:hypothetical protein
VLSMALMLHIERDDVRIAPDDAGTSAVRWRWRWSWLRRWISGFRRSFWSRVWR